LDCRFVEPGPERCGERRLARPRRDDRRGRLRALALFKRRDFALFILCAFMTSIFGSNFYNPMFGDYFGDALDFPAKYASTFATLKQLSELIFTAALSFAVLRVGVKGALAL
jgi:hypothetical protein